MRNWLIIILMMFLCTTVCCKRGEQDSKKKYPKYGLSVDEVDSILDEWIERGECIIVRGSDREYDTIIDHVMFRFVTSPIYDTPVDSSKHPELMNK